MSHYLQGCYTKPLLESRRLLFILCNYLEEGLFSDDIAITSQRYPTQNNFTFTYTKSADLYWATICWLLMRESEKFSEVGQFKINKCQLL